MIKRLLFVSLILFIAGFCFAGDVTITLMGIDPLYINVKGNSQPEEAGSFSVFVYYGNDGTTDLETSGINSEQLTSTFGWGTGFETKSIESGSWTRNGKTYPNRVVYANVDLMAANEYWPTGGVNALIIDWSTVGSGSAYLELNGNDALADFSGSAHNVSIVNNDVSLPVELATFTASGEDNGMVTLSWTTESEINNLGFNIYRSTGMEGEFDKINQKLIDGAGTSSSSNTYTFVDNRTEAQTTYFYKLEDIDVDGKSRFHGPVKVFVETASIPDAFNLKQNYPNPFNPTTTITYGLPEASQVRLQVFNMIGERVKTLVQTHQPAGNYTVEWNGTTDSGRLLPSGIYFYRLDAGPHSDMKKMILAR